MIPGDLIMSVIEEAQRQNAQLSPMQSAKLKAVSPAETADSFTTVLKVASATDQNSAVATQPTKLAAVRVSPKKQSAEVMLQGLLLQSVLEVMLSQQGDSFTGKGTAGRMWKSMLAEHIAAEVGRSIDLHLLRDDKPGAVQDDSDQAPFQAARKE